MKPARLHPIGTQRNPKHGLSTLKRAVKELGNRAIDPCTKVGRTLRQFRGELVNDLGGEASISAQQREVINLAVSTKLLHDSITTWLLQQPSLVNKRHRTVYPVVLQRQTLADALCRYLDRLGLERKAKQIPTLQDYISQKGSPQP